MISGWASKILAFLLWKLFEYHTFFFSLLFCVIILRDNSSVLNKNLSLGSVLLGILTFLRCSSIWGGFCCDLFLPEYFIQLLINNTGGPLHWVLIFSPDLLIFLKSYIKGLPVIGRIKKTAQSLESPFSSVVTVHSCGKIGLCRYQLIFDTNDSWFFYLRLGLCLDLGMPGLRFRFVSQEWIVCSCEDNLHTQGNLEGSPLPCTLCHPHTSWIISIPVCPLFYLLLHNRNRSKQFPARSYILCQWYLGILHETSFCMIRTRFHSLGK